MSNATTGLCLCISLVLLGGYAGCWLRLGWHVQQHPAAGIAAGYLVCFALPVAAILMGIVLTLFVRQRRLAALLVATLTAATTAFVWSGTAAAVGGWFAR